MGTVVRYGRVAQFFHWTTVILVGVAFALGPERSDGEMVRRLHETLGLLVLVLTVLRLWWRRRDATPPLENLPEWMVQTAKWVQRMLYGLLLAVPLSAGLGASLGGYALNLVAGVNVAVPIGVHHEWGHLLITVHPWLADALMGLAGLHAAAAIFHHVVLRDGVLLSMLPVWAERWLRRSA